MSSTVFNDENFTLLRMLESEVLSEPHEHYRALREYDPVHWDPYMHSWVVTSYAEAVTVLTQCSANRTPSPAYLDELGLGVMKPFANMMLRQMMFMDGSMHQRLRGICSAAFTTRRIEAMRSEIEVVANRLIDSFINEKSTDLVATFANQLPAIVTAQLLGVPEKDHGQVHSWVIDLAEIFGNFQHRPDRISQILHSLDEFKTYIAALMDEERRNPSQGLIHALMSTDVDGQKLSDEEVIANAIITLVGGHETTTNLISSGYLTLLRRPKLFEQLRADPKIAPTAVEELLRYEAPVQHTARIASQDLKLGGKVIARGSRIVVVLAAANRDPNRFPHPDQLDLLRSDNRHLSFGWAAHFCFGAPLARVEGQVAFNALLRRLRRPVILDQQLEWRQNAGLRGLTHLNIRFEQDRP